MHRSTAVDHPQRSRILTGWLIYVVLANLWTAYRGYEVIRDLVEHADPRWTEPLTWALPLAAVLSVIAALAAAAMIFRLKAGYYAYLSAALVGGALLILVLGVPIGTLLLPAIGLIVTVALVSSRWEEFDRRR